MWSHDCGTFAGEYFDELELEVKARAGALLAAGWLIPHSALRANMVRGLQEFASELYDEHLWEAQHAYLEHPFYWDYDRC